MGGWDSVRLSVRSRSGSVDPLRDITNVALIGHYLLEQIKWPFVHENIHEKCLFPLMNWGAELVLPQFLSPPDGLSSLLQSNKGLTDVPLTVTSHRGEVVSSGTNFEASLRNTSWKKESKGNMWFLKLKLKWSETTVLSIEGWTTCQKDSGMRCLCRLECVATWSQVEIQTRTDTPSMWWWREPPLTLLVHSVYMQQISRFKMSVTHFC